MRSVISEKPSEQFHFSSLPLKSDTTFDQKPRFFSTLELACLGALETVATGAFLTGFEASLADIPGNLLQSTAGAVFGLILSEAIVKAYPPVKKFAW